MCYVPYITLSHVSIFSLQSPEDIIAMCSSLQQSLPGHDSFLLLATEASLRDQTKTDMSSELLGHVTPVRNHFFWPLTVRTRNVRAMTDILNKMQALNLRIDYDTLAFYVFPNLIPLDTPISLLQSLQKNCNLSVSSLLGPLVHALLSSKLLNEALKLCKFIYFVYDFVWLNCHELHELNEVKFLITNFYIELLVLLGL